MRMQLNHVQYIFHAHVQILLAVYVEYLILVYCCVPSLPPQSWKGVLGHLFHNGYTPTDHFSGAMSLLPSENVCVLYMHMYTFHILRGVKAHISGCSLCLECAMTSLHYFSVIVSLDCSNSGQPRY